MFYGWLVNAHVTLSKFVMLKNQHGSDHTVCVYSKSSMRNTEMYHYVVLTIQTLNRLL